jgi:hypothetical protein
MTFCFRVAESIAEPRPPNALHQSRAKPNKHASMDPSPTRATASCAEGPGRVLSISLRQKFWNKNHCLAPSAKSVVRRFSSRSFSKKFGIQKVRQDRDLIGRTMTRNVATTALMPGLLLQTEIGFGILSPTSGTTSKRSLADSMCGESDSLNKFLHGLFM